MSGRDNPVRNVIGSGGMEKYGESRYLPGEATLEDAMPGMRDEVYGRVDGGPPQETAWNRDGNQLGPDTGQSDGAPSPGILSQIPQGHERVSMHLHRVSWVVSHMECTKKLFQPAVLEGQIADPGGNPPTFN